MKKLMLTAMVVGAFLFSSQTEAQFRVNVNLNIGRPSWGLPATYPGDYYYLPEIDTYYDIPRSEFVYFDGRGWVYASELPYQYRDYDLYNGYKVVINEPRPFLHCDVYRQRYNRYYNTYQPRVVISQIQNYPLYPDYRYDNDRYNNGRYDNERYEKKDKFKRIKENQHFDNRRNDDDRDERFDNGRGYGNNGYGNNGKGNGHGNGRWKNEGDRD